MLHPFHGKRNPSPLQLAALAFSETLVFVSQITCCHVRGDLYLPSFFLFCFKARSHCPENRLFASPCPSVSSRISAWLSLDGYLWNLVWGTLMKICREEPNLVKIGLKYQALYVTAKGCHIVGRYICRAKRNVTHFYVSMTPHSIFIILLAATCM
jgi:hypothetical protein